MRVLLISPTTAINYYTAKSRVYPPMGLYRLKFWCEDRLRGRAKIDVINSDILNPWEYLKNHAKHYDIIGVSSLHETLENDLSLMLTARKFNPKAIIVAGGPEATFNYEQIIEYANPDYIIRGEGEYPLTELIENKELPDKIVTGRKLNEVEFNFASWLLKPDKMGIEEAWEETKRRLPNAENIRTGRIFTESRCPKRCLLPDEKIETPYGEIPIEKISLGDVVYSYSFKEKKVVENEVIQLHESYDEEIIEIETDNGKIEVTPEHPIYTRRGWIPAKYIGDDEIFVVPTWAKVRKIRRKNRRAKVYNIATYPDENYIVDGHLVHNCRYCSETNFPVNFNFLTAKMVIYHIRQFQKIGAEYILLHGDNFVLGKKGKERLKKFEEYGFTSPIPMMAQCDCRDLSYENAVKMKKLGINKISLGVESFSDNILRDFGKRGQTVDLVNETLETLLEVGIDVYANMILVSPNCTEEDIRETLEGIKYWMSRGIEFGINLYPRLFRGSWYAEQIYKGNEIGYHIPEKVEIPFFGIKFEKMGKLLPKDKKIREMILRVERELEKSKTRVTAEKLSEKIVKEIQASLENL